MILLMFIVIPLLGALLSVLTGIINAKFSRYIAVFSMFICFLGSFFCFFYSRAGYSLYSTTTLPFLITFYKSWLPSCGISFYLGMDKLSWLMVFLTSFLGVLSVLYEWRNLNNYIGIFYCLLLCMISGIFGIFLSLDLFLFFLFWEMILIPMYFLILFWGKNKIRCDNNFSVAHKFFIYSQLSGLILLFSILNLSYAYYQYSGIWTFNYFFLKNVTFSFCTEFFLMCGFLVSFIIKMPLFPFHNWFPDTQECISTSGSVDLIGMLLKPAIYGLLRFVLIFFPRTFYSCSYVCLSLGFFSVFYGLIMAFSQVNIKKMISYSSIASMGMIFSALSSANIYSYQGVILYLFSYIISTAALLLLIGKIFNYTGTQNIFRMQGLWCSLQFIPSFFLFFSFANLNIPLTGNFCGEFMMLFGIFCSFPIFSSFFVFSLFFSALYSLMIIHRVFYGATASHITITDELNIFDWIILCFCLFCVFFLGLCPKFFLNFSHEISQKLYQKYMSF